MKKILLALLLAINVQAEKYVIYWDGDPDITNYSIEQSNVETGFGTMKRFGTVKEGTQEYTVDLANGLSYTIKIRGYDNFGNVVESNTLVIKTKKDKPAPKIKPLVIKARRRYGAFLIPRRETVSSIKKHAENNHLALYGFASDQSPKIKRKTYFRLFFGTEVPVFTGAERIAKEHDIPVLMAKVRRVKRGFYETEIIVLSKNPKEVKDFEITDQFTEELESLIKEDPSHYLWTHNRFKRLRKATL